MRLFLAVLFGKYNNNGKFTYQGKQCNRFMFAVNMARRDV